MLRGKPSSRWILAVFWMLPLLLCADPAPLPEASYQHLPRWRGFNLLEKFMKGQHNEESPYQEEDFRLISQWGFNFVRLAIDYRELIVDGDWTKFNEPAFKDIDQAVAWGQKYQVHVCLNYNRAPGYTVATPPEALNLFKDPEALRVCALHWAYMAKRYKGIPNENLSFNPINEPPILTGAEYARVIKVLSDAIHAEDPNRLVICDGLFGSTMVPVPELIPLHVAQSVHCYFPWSLTMYQAPWMSDSNQELPPTWPVTRANGFLYGPDKPEFNSTMSIEGPWKEGAKLRLHVNQESSDATLLVRADGQVIFRKDFHPGPGAGEWEKTVYLKDWKIYQGTYNKDYEADIPAGTQKVELLLSKGDWLTLQELHIIEGPKDYVLGMQELWGVRQAPIRFDPDNAAMPFDLQGKIDGQYVWEHVIEPWKALEAQGVGVHVGEFGVYNKTPHAVALAWMKDNLANWKKAGWGWALWNFRGCFGVLDSGRSDVTYENVDGHQVDREMLNLLQQY